MQIGEETPSSSENELSPDPVGVYNPKANITKSRSCLYSILRRRPNHFGWVTGNKSRQQEEPHPTFISGSIYPEEKEVYIDFLKQNWDIFTWTYTEMSCLDAKVSLHHLSIEIDKPIVKKRPRQMHLDLTSKIEGKVYKLIKANFIQNYDIPRGWLI